MRLVAEYITARTFSNHFRMSAEINAGVHMKYTERHYLDGKIDAAVSANEFQ